MKRSRGLTLANLFRSGNTKVPYFQIGFDIQDCVSPIRVSGDATAGGDCKCCSTRIFQFDAKRLAAGIRFSQYLRSINVASRCRLLRKFGAAQSLPYGNVGLIAQTRSHTREWCAQRFRT